MPDVPRRDRLLADLIPQSLLGRLSLVMLAGMLLAQLAGMAVWSMQQRVELETETRAAARHIAHSAVRTIRFFLSLPPNFRPLVIEQFREMGGTRFFANINQDAVNITHIEQDILVEIALAEMRAAIAQDLPWVKNSKVVFAAPDGLAVADDGLTVNDLPERWVRHILLIEPKPAPVMVIQVEMEPGNWLYLAGLMPNPYFLDGGKALNADRVLPQALSLVAVVLLSILVVRSITRPLAALSDAADAFGKGETGPPLPQTGSREFMRSAQAFADMRERIRCYIEDRERLFMSISHDLRTPIMRLKLRTELLDNDALRKEFHEDLDDLDMMVKGALQCVKDSEIHENPAEIRLDAMIDRMVRGARLAGREVAFNPSGTTVIGKPLALKRAIGNLLDNALYYGKQAEVAVHETADLVMIDVRDHGPGVPESALRTLFEPKVRLEHGRRANQGGMGLGLGIARGIVQAHHGRLTLENHPDGGLIARIALPRRTADT